MPGYPGVWVEDLQRGGAHIGEHANVVADLLCFGASGDKSIGLGKGEDLVIVPFGDVLVGEHVVQNSGVLGKALLSRQVR